LSDIALAIYIFGLPLIVLCGAHFLSSKFGKSKKPITAIILLWLLCLLAIFCNFHVNIPYLVTLSAINLFLFLIPLSLFTLFVVRSEASQALLRIVKWIVWVPVALIFSFFFFFLQPGEGLDFDGAMESSGACRRALAIVEGAGEIDGIIGNRLLPYDYIVGQDTHRWSTVSHEITCRANHYLRRVTVFKVNGVSKLHLIEKSEREFKRF